MTVESWTRTQYEAAVKTALEEDFEEVDGELGKLPDFQRLDFDPQWEVGKAVPGQPEFTIYGIFVGDMAGDRSVYCFPASAEPAVKAWRRYTLSRVMAAPELEGMARATFVAELAEEYSALIDPDTCPKCGQDVEADGGEEPEPGDTLPPTEAPTAAASPAALKG